MKDKHVKMYMKMAGVMAEQSKDSRLQVGCVIVKDNNIISTGYNGHTRHIDDPNQLEDGTTDPRVRHAEKNGLMKLIRSNENAVGATMFVTHACCYFCAIDIVDSGIAKVYYQNEYRCKKGLEHLERYGVEVCKL
jgi:dCMP deaminase